MTSISSDAFAGLIAPYGSLREAIRTQESTGVQIPVRARAYATKRKLGKYIAGRPVTLFLNDYDIGDGLSGGAHRIRELVERAKVPGVKILLTFTNSERVEYLTPFPDLIYVLVPKSLAQKLCESFFADGNEISVNDIIASFYAQTSYILGQIMEYLTPQISTIVLEHPYMAPLAAKAKAARPHTKVIYNAHNVEALLKRDLLVKTKHSDAAPLLQRVQQMEADAVGISSHINAVTQQDAARLEELYEVRARPEVLINGATVLPQCRARSYPDGGAHDLLFVGSAHPPNITAMRAFLGGDCWRARDQYRLHIIGSVGQELAAFRSPRVQLYGVINNEEMAKILAHVDIALNPITAGGGSSLKLGQYLANGLPMVTTPEGARGFDLTDNQQALFGEMENGFFTALDRLAHNKKLYERLSQAGLAFAAAELSWDVVAQKLSLQFG